MDMMQEASRRQAAETELAAVRERAAADRAAHDDALGALSLENARLARENTALRAAQTVRRCL